MPENLSTSFYGLKTATDGEDDTSTSILNEFTHRSTRGPPSGQDPGENDQEIIFVIQDKNNTNHTVLQLIPAGPRLHSLLFLT